MDTVCRLSRETSPSLQNYGFGGFGKKLKAQFGSDLAKRILCFLHGS